MEKPSIGLERLREDRKKCGILDERLIKELHFYRCMTKYYIDSNIWIDFLKDRKGPKGEPFGEYAEIFLATILVKGDHIVGSKTLFDELIGNLTAEEINNVMKKFQNIIKVDTDKEQTEEAKKLAKRGVPEKDALHAVLARENRCVLVTRDKHFELLKDITITVKPEDII